MSDQVIPITETPFHTEQQWQKIAKDILIAAYVPNSPELGRRDALELALQRDAQAAFQLEQDAISEANLKRAAITARNNHILHELGY